MLLQFDYTKLLVIKPLLTLCLLSLLTACGGGNGGDGGSDGGTVSAKLLVDGSDGNNASVTIDASVSGGVFNIRWNGMDELYHGSVFFSQDALLETDQDKKLIGLNCNTPALSVCTSTYEGTCTLNPDKSITCPDAFPTTTSIASVLGQDNKGYLIFQVCDGLFTSCQSDVVSVILSGFDKTVSLETIKNENPNITITAMDIVSEVDSKSILKTSWDMPLDVFSSSDKSFRFSWNIDASVAVFASNFLTLQPADKPEADEVALFSLFANPKQSSLNAEASCNYDNDNKLTCKLPASNTHYASETTTDLTNLLSEEGIPAVFLVKSEVCSALGGCNVVKLGYMRIN